MHTLAPTRRTVKKSSLSMDYKWILGDVWMRVSEPLGRKAVMTSADGMNAVAVQLMKEDGVLYLNGSRFHISTEAWQTIWGLFEHCVLLGNGQEVFAMGTMDRAELAKCTEQMPIASEALTDHERRIAVQAEWLADLVQAATCAPTTSNDISVEEASTEDNEDPGGLRSLLYGNGDGTTIYSGFIIKTPEYGYRVYIEEIDTP
jgi:hypothetical protein